MGEILNNQLTFFYLVCTLNYNMNPQHTTLRDRYTGLSVTLDPPLLATFQVFNSFPNIPLKFLRESTDTENLLFCMFLMSCQAKKCPFVLTDIIEH